MGDLGWSLGWEDPLEEAMAAHSSVLMENPMDRGAWRAAVHGVAQSQTTERLSTAQRVEYFHEGLSVPCLNFP